MPSLVRRMYDLNVAQFIGECLKSLLSTHQALVAQRLDSTIHQINHYPVNSAISFPNSYPLDSDLSCGQRFPTFEQPGHGMLWIQDT